MPQGADDLPVGMLSATWERIPLPAPPPAPQQVPPPIGEAEESPPGHDLLCFPNFPVCTLLGPDLGDGQQ